MRKNNYLKSFVFLMVLLLVVLSLSACSIFQKKSMEAVELKLAHFFPGTHPAETELVQGWAKEIKQATNNLVTITSYPGETLAKAADIYNGVVEGVADIGISAFAYSKGRFPILEAFEQPGVVYKNSKVASKVAWEAIKELNPKEVQDTKLLMVIATGPGDLFTKTPIRKLDDLKGMQIRATGLSAETLGMLGATPVGMPQSEAYEALSKGIVKGNLSPIEVLKSWKQAEVTSYITETPFLYNTLFFVTMNLEKWNSFPEDIQKSITETTEKFFDQTAIGLWDKQNEAARSYAVDEKKMEVITLSEEEADKWIEKVKPMQDKYISDKGKDGEAAMKKVLELADKYNAEY